MAKQPFAPPPVDPTGAPPPPIDPPPASALFAPPGDDPAVDAPDYSDDLAAAPRDGTWIAVTADLETWVAVRWYKTRTRDQATRSWVDKAFWVESTAPLHRKPLDFEPIAWKVLPPGWRTAQDAGRLRE